MITGSGEKSYNFSFQKLFTQCKKLSSVNISTQENSKFKSSFRMSSNDGAVFTETDANIYRELIYYPPGKTDTTFEFTSKVNVAFDKYTFCCNPHIQTAKCPSALFIQSDVATGEYHPTALKTIYVNEQKKSENKLWAEQYYTFKYY